MASASDNFNRADENPLANGTWGGNGTQTQCKIVTNQVKSSSAGRSLSRWTANTFTADQYAQQTYISEVEGGSGPACRCAGAANTYYYVAGWSGGVQVAKLVAGTQTIIIDDRTFGHVNGDIKKLQTVGTTIKYFKNGVEKDSVTDTSITAADPPGCNVYGGDVEDNWSAADIGGVTVVKPGLLLMGVGV